MSRTKLPFITEALLRILIPSDDSKNLLATFEELYLTFRSDNPFTAIFRLWAEILSSVPGFMKYALQWRMSMIKSNFRISVRNINKNRGSSIINILGLTLGMVSFALIFFYVRFELSYDGFHKNSASIYRLRNDRIYATSHDKSAGCPPACAPFLKKDFPQVENTTRLRLRGNTSIYIGDDSPAVFFESNVIYAENSFFEIFSFKQIRTSGVSPLLKPHTAVITQSTAEKFFGKSNPLGKSFKISSRAKSPAYTITGVVDDPPPNSHIKFSMLLSFASYKKSIEPRENVVIDELWGWNAFPTYILLKPGTDPSSIEAALPEFVKRYKLGGTEYKRELYLQPLKDIHLGEKLRYNTEEGGNIRTVHFLSVIGVLILLIAWINYTNLTTARSILRSREIGVKKVFGSNRSELVKQFIVESLLINSTAILLSLIIVAITIPMFVGFTGKDLSASISASDIAIAVGILFSGAFIAGLYPALMLSSIRPSAIFNQNLSSRLKGFNLRKVMVVFQFSISIILIIATLAVYNQLSFMQNRNLGIDIEKTIILPTPFNSALFKFAAEAPKHPGVKTLSISSSVPGREYSNSSSGVRRSSVSEKESKHCFYIDIDNQFFDLYGVGFAAGRNFNEHSKYNKSVIINETAARHLGFRSPADAVDKTIVLGGLAGQIVKIEGVVRDYHHKSLNNTIKPVIYNPLDRIGYYSIKIKMDDPAAVIADLEKLWKKTFQNSPFEYTFLDDIFNAQYKSDIMFGKVFRLFTGLAILISSIGLFGLISFTYSRRTREVGIRKVLGAPVKSIVKLLTKELVSLITIALIIAWPVGWYAMNSWLSNFAYRAELQWWIFPLSGAITLMIAMITVSGQALKTANTNPVTALKHE